MEMSENMAKQAKELSAGVDDLVDMTRETNVKLHNTFNQFLNLSSYQYVENVCIEKRLPDLTEIQSVYDEDEKIKEKKEQSVDKPADTEDVDAVIVPKFTGTRLLSFLLFNCFLRCNFVRHESARTFEDQRGGWRYGGYGQDASPQLLVQTSSSFHHWHQRVFRRRLRRFAVWIWR